MLNWIRNILGANKALPEDAFGEIKIMFHKQCNMVGSHGTILVTHKARGMHLATIRFMIADVAVAPALTPKLLYQIKSAAESQGFLFYELVSYARMQPVNNDAEEVEARVMPVSQAIRNQPAEAPHMANLDTPAYLRQSGKESDAFIRNLSTGQPEVPDTLNEILVDYTQMNVVEKFVNASDLDVDAKERVLSAVSQTIVSGNEKRANKTVLNSQVLSLLQRSGVHTDALASVV